MEKRGGGSSPATPGFRFHLRVLLTATHQGFLASHAARCIACHGVRSHADAVALVIECSIPVV